MKRYATACLLGIFLLGGCAAVDNRSDMDPDLASLEMLQIPPLSGGAPAAGRRVTVTPSEYAGTDVFHTVYLPKDWRPTGRRLPIIFEFTGNYHPPSGSTGEPQDAALGYGLSGGRFIWVSLPYVASNGEENAVTWWGDERATTQYAKKNVRRIIEELNADPDAVFLCGFSRGAIAVNYIGLRDDEIAAYWTAFVTHDHFDGAREWSNTPWGTPLETYRRAALERLRRVHGRPYLVIQNTNTGAARVSGSEAYLRPLLADGDDFTFLYVNTTEILGPFPNQYAKHPHTDRWPVLPSQSRERAWKWVNRVAQEAVEPAETSQSGEGKHLFILSGQSNMAGMDPGATFIPILEEEFGKKNIMVVTHAEGSKPIRRWYKRWKPTKGIEPAAEADMYERLIKKVKTAAQEKKIMTVTLIWMQGETDAREGRGEVYADSLKGLVTQIGEDLDRDDINFVIGRLSDHGTNMSKFPHWQMIRNAQVDFANSDPRGAWINTDDLNDGKNKRGEKITNDLHYSVAGYKTLGERFAQKAIGLIKALDQTLK